MNNAKPCGAIVAALVLCVLVLSGVGNCSGLGQLKCALQPLSGGYIHFMNLKEWAIANGVHPHTAYRWFRVGTLPVPAERVGPRTILVNIEANSSPCVTGGVGLYARVSSHDQKSDLERQIARPAQWAVAGGHRVVRIESETASGMNGGRAKAKRLLAGPDVPTVVVEHKDRVGRMNVELIEAALAATGRPLVVRDDGEVEDDLVRDMIEIPTSFCARLYGLPLREEPGEESPGSGGRR
jgi:putative resolvase